MDDTQLLQALMRRSPERENQLQTVVCEEDFKEFLERLTMLLERNRSMPAS